MTIRLMIIDNHDMVRAGLTQYFEMQHGIEMVAEAANGKELLEKLETTPADILLLDMAMPGISGADLITIIKSLYPALRILVLSMHNEIQVVLSAMNAGASGYILKNCSPQMLLEAVKEVMETGKYLTPHMAERLANASVAEKLSGELNRNDIPAESEHSDLKEIIRSADEGVEKLHSKSSPAWQPKCQQEYEWNNCQVSMVGNTDLVECLQEIKRCRWVLSFGDKRYCKHPLAKQFVCSKQP